ncbi:hypothetical protein EV356DRAFT_39465 [Viridothelium virens]|uniref:Uncharacterized protein n=1 Tax=Viridothelium virens TaxID=1048519 RepID=A0A6A6HG68_VIRVR|nr:hypothetical protein EV356DRAFT_39465 [Viridothelium virens]
MSKRWLVTRFDLVRNELSITFFKSEHATEYQIANPEARILADENEPTVWLPTLNSMKSIRGCSDGLAVCFDSEKAARSWCERSIIGSMKYGEKTEVYIQREWSEAALDERIAAKSKRLQVPSRISRSSSPRTPEQNERRDARASERTPNR